jgi:hypothetical protein
VPDDAGPMRSAESQDRRWFPVHTLPAGTDDSVRALVRHALLRTGG